MRWPRQMVLAPPRRSRRLSRGDNVPAEDANLCSPRGFRELFRYQKNGRTRTYRLRAVGAASELWVVTGGGGQKPKSRRLMTLTDPGDTEPLVESIEQELRAGGWSRA